MYRQRDLGGSKSKRQGSWRSCDTVNCGYSKQKARQEMRLYVARGQNGVLRITVKNYFSENSRAGWGHSWEEDTKTSSDC